jgi:hypothetical protein
MRYRMLLITSCLSGLAILLSWPHVRSSPVGNFSEISNPAAAGSRSPSLSATAKGDVILSWLEPSGAEQALRFSVRSKSVWGSVETVIRRPDFDVYAEAPPSILALENGSILAVWAQKLNGTGKWPGNYLYTSASQDGGKTWSPAARIHSDNSNSEHSFSSIAATGRDRATVIWLDARDYESQHRYRLMAATLNFKGEVTNETTIDDDTCTCCPTAFVATPTGGVAAYRGHSPQELRDIKVSRLAGEIWEVPRPVHDDNWHINGCPVSGPALSANKDRLAVLWFTGRDDQPQVEMELSEDLGKTFQAPQILDSRGKESRPIGHVAVSLLDSGGVVAVWLQQGRSEARIVGQRISKNGHRGELFVLARGTVRGLGYPRLERAGFRVMVSWSGTTGEEMKTAEMSGADD